MDPNTRALALWLVLEIDAAEAEAARVAAMPRISAELRGKARGLRLVMDRLARQMDYSGATDLEAHVRADRPNRTAISEGEARALDGNR